MSLIRDNVPKIVMSKGPESWLKNIRDYFMGKYLKFSSKIFTIHPTFTSQSEGFPMKGN